MFLQDFLVKMIVHVIARALKILDLFEIDLNQDGDDERDAALLDLSGVPPDVMAKLDSATLAYY